MEIGASAIEPQAPLAEVVELPRPTSFADLAALARLEERKNLPPPDRDGDDGDDGDVREQELEDPRPPSDSEVREAVLSLRGAHAKSADEVRRYACQLPRAFFMAVLEEVQVADTDGSSKRPVGLLIYRLKVEIGDRAQRALAEVAIAASEQFGYGEQSPVERLRDDPERWIRTLSPQLEVADVDEYLRRQVPDELERRRLRTLADELRATT